MPFSGLSVFGAWSFPGVYGITAGTQIVRLVPPGTLPENPSVGPQQFSIGGPVPLPYPSASALLRQATWGTPSVGTTHVTDLVYTTSTTAHNLYLMTPINWTYTTAVSAKNTATITLAYDPGILSTNYAYTTASGQSVATGVDTGIANTDFVAFQLADGTWFVSKVSSYAAPTLTLATTLPNPTSAYTAIVLANTPVFWFGQPTSTHAASGQIQWTTKTVASTNRVQVMASNVLGGFAAGRAGDPVLFIADNLTAAGSLDYIGGFYAKY